MAGNVVDLAVDQHQLHYFNVFHQDPVQGVDIWQLIAFSVNFQ